MFPRNAADRPSSPDFLTGGETGALMRAYDWSTSPLGEPETWPQPLKTLVGVTLGSSQPMFVAWGQRRTLLYNDAYAALMSDRHPAALARPFFDIWPDTVDQTVPLFERVFAGEPVQMDDIEFALMRDGRPQEAHFAFSYTPVRDEVNAVAGLFCVCSETTQAVLTERRRDALLNLDDRLRDLADTADVSFAASELLGEALGAARVGYGTVDAQAGTITVERNWCVPGFGDVAGLHRFADYGTYVDDLLRGEPVTNTDIEADPRTAANLGSFHALGIRAFLDMPVVERGHTVAQLFVHSETPRIWTDEEVAFVRDFAERTRAAIARRLAEQALTEAEYRLKNAVDAAGLSADFRVLLEASPTPFLVVAPPDWTIVAANDARLRVTGMTREAQIGRKLFDVFPDDPDDPTANGVRNLTASFERVVATRASDAMAVQRYAVREADGRFVERWWSPINSPVLDRAGNVALIIHRAEDVTEVEQMRGEAAAQDQLSLDQQAVIERLRASEAALRESEARFRLMADAVPQIVWITDRHGGMEFLNKQFVDYTGADAAAWTQAEVAANFMHADDGAKVVAAFEAALVTGEPFEIEHRIRSATGEDRWFLARAEPYCDPGTGEIVRWFGASVDIHDRKLAEAELRESEARQAFLLSLTDALRSLSTPAEIASAAAERLGQQFGLNRVFYAEYSGSTMRVERDFTRGVDSIVGEHDMAAFGSELLRAYHECPIVKADDVQADARFSEDARAGLRARQVGAYLDVVLFEDERWVSLLAFQSATPRTWTASEEGLFREVGERVKSAIERARAEEQLRELNDTLERRVEERTAERDRMWETSPDLMLVIDFEGVFRRVSPAWTSVLGYGPEELVGRHVNEFVLPDDHNETTHAYELAATGGRPVVVNRYRHKDGSTRWISWTAAPAGELTYATGRDITPEKEREAELVQAQEALRQSQKMEAMGSLTGGVAHDFNNLLSPIIGGLDLLQRRGVGDERAQRLIGGALQSAERAKTLVQRLLAFARRQPLQPTAVDVGTLVEGMADLVASTTGPQVKVVVDVAPRLPPARADANQIEMALLNLSVNARDAMSDGGTLTIAASLEEVGTAHRSKLPPGRYVGLSVADTGAGMDTETLRRAVEPFFSTKGVGKGTGLGLSMAHGLAAQLGGALAIASRPGLGTKVELWLPVAETDAEAPARSDAPGEAATSGTALLVDDEELVRTSTAEMLADLGLVVVESACAEEALALIDDGLLPDILVTDHLMPRKTGSELAREVRLRLPGVPVLVVSGYAEVDGIAPDLPRLTKPFRRDDLAAAVAELVRAPG